MTKMRQLIVLLLHIFLLSPRGTAQRMPRWMPQGNQCSSDLTERPRTEPVSGPAPPVPKLPNQYSMKVECNIFQSGKTTEVEEHYDYPNQRASASLTRNGTTVWSFFDYKVGERYNVYPDGSCKAETSKFNFFGFTNRLTKKRDRPVMATVNEVFSFGGQVLNQTYVGRSNVRGIPVDHWTSCQAWPQFGAKFQVDWYFSTPEFKTASLHTQIPVRLVVDGYATNMESLSQKMAGNHTFQHVYEFQSFRSGPHENEDVFELPLGVVCKDRKKSDKDEPRMPDRFEMSVEVVVPNSHLPPRQQYLRYDYDHKLVESWARMTVPQGMGVVNKGMIKHRGKPSTDSADNDMDDEKLITITTSVVEDHKNGVAYHMDKINFTCTVTQLDAQADSLTMSHGNNLLFLGTPGAKDQGGLEYQGQATIREMRVDVWGMEQDGVVQQVYFLPPRSRFDDDSDGGQRPGKKPKEGNTPEQKSTHSDQDNDQSQTHRSDGRRPPRTYSTTTDRTYQQRNRNYNSSPKPKPTKPTSKKTNMNRLPYPILVGMYIKNHTTNASPANMMHLMSTVMTKEAMRWAKYAGYDPKELFTPDQDTRRSDSPMSAMNTSDQVAWGRRMERIMDGWTEEKLINVFHYHPVHLDGSNFQVSFCYQPEQTSQVVLTVMAKFHAEVLHYYTAFSNSLRNAIASTTGLSVLQISDLVPMPMKMESLHLDGTKVTFTLLGRPPGMEKYKNFRQEMLEEAKKKLVGAIQMGIAFTVEYTDHSKAFMVDKSMYFVDYDKLQMEQMLKKKDKGEKGKQSSMDADEQSNDLKGVKAEQSDDNDDDSGYSSGAVAAISITCIVLGAAVCLGVVFFLHKRRRPGQSFVPYKMT